MVTLQSRFSRPALLTMSGESSDALRALEADQKAWLGLWRQLRHAGHQDIAGPMMGSGLQDGVLNSPRILYVGKATGGSWFAESITDATTIEDCRSWTTDFLKEREGIGAFWRLFDRLMELTGEDSLKTHLSERVIWTNLYRIGAIVGNPTEWLRREQETLALRTLKHEIEFYRPSLIMFVTNEFGYALVREVTQDANAETWNEESGDLHFWWRGARGDLPPIIWANHPQGKSRKVIDAWVDKARELLLARV